MSSVPPEIQQYLDDLAKGTAVLRSWNLSMDHSRAYETIELEIVRPLSGQYISMMQIPPHPTYSHTVQMVGSLAQAQVTFKAAEKKPLKDGGMIVEPIVGYRDWDMGFSAYDAHAWLESRNGSRWPGYEPLAMECKSISSKNRWVGHENPHPECSCGIYATTDHKHPDLDRSDVWGEVYLWGEVLVCETGYRAEFAYPKRLFVPSLESRLARKMGDALRAEYGVPVEVWEGGE